MSESTGAFEQGNGHMEWTVKHPGGRIGAFSTASEFGPTRSISEALSRLEVAESYCSCRDDQDPRRHVLVTRFVPAPTEWVEVHNGDGSAT